MPGARRPTRAAPRHSAINKPGPQTPEERTLVETHTLIGEEMLDKVGGVLGKSAI